MRHLLRNVLLVGAGIALFPLAEPVDALAGRPLDAHASQRPAQFDPDGTVDLLGAVIAAAGQLSGDRELQINALTTFLANADADDADTIRAQEIADRGADELRGRLRGFSTSVEATSTSAPVAAAAVDVTFPAPVERSAFHDQLSNTGFFAPSTFVGLQDQAYGPGNGPYLGAIVSIVTFGAPIACDLEMITAIAAPGLTPYAAPQGSPNAVFDGATSAHTSGCEPATAFFNNPDLDVFEPWAPAHFIAIVDDVYITVAAYASQEGQLDVKSIVRGPSGVAEQEGFEAAIPAKTLFEAGADANAEPSTDAPATDGDAPAETVDDPPLAEAGSDPAETADVSDDQAGAVESVDVDSSTTGEPTPSADGSNEDDPLAGDADAGAADPVVGQEAEPSNGEAPAVPADGESGDDGQTIAIAVGGVILIVVIIGGAVAFIRNKNDDEDVTFAPESGGTPSGDRGSPYVPVPPTRLDDTRTADDRSPPPEEEPTISITKDADNACADEQQACREARALAERHRKKLRTMKEELADAERRLDAAQSTFDDLDAVHQRAPSGHASTGDQFSSGIDRALSDGVIEDGLAQLDPRNDQASSARYQQAMDDAADPTKRDLRRDEFHDDWQQAFDGLADAKAAVETAARLVEEQTTLVANFEAAADKACKAARDCEDLQAQKGR